MADVSSHAAGPSAAGDARGAVPASATRATATAGDGAPEPSLLPGTPSGARDPRSGEVVPRSGEGGPAGADPRRPGARHVASRPSATDRLRDSVRDLRDRFVASDPGFTRLRQGVRAFVAVGTTLLVEWALAAAIGQPVLSFLLLGAVVAMLMSTGIREQHRTVVLRTGLASPVLAAGGVTVGVLSAERPLLGSAAFVVVSFGAVYVRRWGPRWFTLGFLFWQGFFFSLFLHPPTRQLPFLLLAVVASGLWVLLLLLTVLHEDPHNRLRRIVAALRARARSGIAAALDVLADPGDRGAPRAVRRALVQLSETALLFDGQLGDRRSLPSGVPPNRLRRWIVDLEIGMDEVCGATVTLAESRPDLPPLTREQVREVLHLLGWGDYAEADRAAERLAGSASVPGAARRLGAAAGLLLHTVHRWDTGDWAVPDEDRWDDEDQFEPVVTLIGGNLPGSAALAAQSVIRQDAGRFSPSRLLLTTRQAIQASVAAGLSILVGELISRQRYYWAVIAAFVGFAGTATSGETLTKGVGRITGTLAGLVAAVALANVTDRHTAAAVLLILLCIGLAFFSQPLSTTAMVFFITVMLGQLYTLLGTFSDALLLVRLFETAAGAAIGVVVALVVLPAHSGATLREARRTFLGTVADLLEACAEVLRGGRPERDPLTLALELDADGRQVIRIRRATTRGRLFGADRTALRHRMSVLASVGSSARTLAGAVSAERPDPVLEQVCTALAGQARRLSEVPSLSSGAPRRAAEDDATAQVREQLDAAPADPATRRAVRALRRLSDGLGLLDPGLPAARDGEQR
ncbi:FUSC family protein [Nakamurella endophytica]|uniref:Integral membrane bound transporter domain-containing protein n=1 Tax=Nakamurella endophytica TaxID=1748367 RepID=A0A917WM03_9ACTN|nr:FUSC family protein [Nakamurella endophytica]GGM13253.1 hypothetical protein GCM10011594_36470 [Nakamurella endophytica]